MPPVGDTRPVLTIYSMAKKENSRWEKRTWPEIKRLAAEVPEAGIHFQRECARGSRDVKLH